MNLVLLSYLTLKVSKLVKDAMRDIGAVVSHLESFNVKEQVCFKLYKCKLTMTAAFSLM